MKEGINRCSIINDSYNSDINSLSIALDFLNQQKAASEAYTHTFRHPAEFDGRLQPVYSSVASLIIEKGITRLIGIGPDISRQSVFIPSRKGIFQRYRRLLTTLFVEQII